MDSARLIITSDLRVLPASDPSHDQRAGAQLEALRTLVQQPTEPDPRPGNNNGMQLGGAKHDNDYGSNN